jgi:hypothetical protein
VATSTVENTSERSTLSENDRTVESIRNSAYGLLSTFRHKLESLQGRTEITDLFISQGYDPVHASSEAIKFFQSNNVHYIAIDGTEFHDARLDMLIFYASAFAYKGIANFFPDGRIVSEPPSSTNDSSCISAAIPLSEEFSSNVFGELGGGGMQFDPNKVSSALMRLAEYYLAYEALSNDSELKIILMDRTVSGDIAHISWKLRDYIRDGLCILLDYETPFGRITKSDLELGRMLIENQELGIPVPRSQFLKFAAMNLLLKDGALGLDAITQKLGVDTPRKISRIEEIKLGQFKEAFVKETGTEKDYGEKVYQLSETTKNYYQRLFTGAIELAEHIFYGKNPMLHHPLKFRALQDRGEERWLKCEDIDYLTLVFITAILKECWERNALLLGIVKDSAANEMVRTVIPVLESARIVQKLDKIGTFGSDTMLLQANSIVNGASISCPWRTFEYDVCFRTINVERDGIAPQKKGESKVKGAFENVIAPERMFVKAYFQLWSSENNPTLRSHVFLYDRPCYPAYDMTTTLRLLNLDNGVEEKITPTVHFPKHSVISEFIIAILDSMGREAIPEALGHNYPLFLADKRAKVAEEEASKSCTAAVELEVTKARLDQQMLFEGKYRNMRSEIEASRKRKRGSKR